MRLLATRPASGDLRNCPEEHMARLEEMDVKIRWAHEEVLEADSGPYAFGPSRTDQVVCALSSLGEA
jgi:hypothetical protein